MLYIFELCENKMLKRNKKDVEINLKRYVKKYEKIKTKAAFNV